MNDQEKELVSLLKPYISMADDTDEKERIRGNIAALCLGARIYKCTDKAIEIVKSNPNAGIDAICDEVGKYFPKVKYVDDE